MVSMCGGCGFDEVGEDAFRPVPDLAAIFTDGGDHKANRLLRHDSLTPPRHRTVGGGCSRPRRSAGASPPQGRKRLRSANPLLLRPGVSPRLSSSRLAATLFFLPTGGHNPPAVWWRTVSLV